MAGQQKSFDAFSEIRSILTGVGGTVITLVLFGLSTHWGIKFLKKEVFVRPTEHKTYTELPAITLEEALEEKEPLELKDKYRPICDEKLLSVLDDVSLTEYEKIPSMLDLFPTFLTTFFEKREPRFTGE